MLSFKFYLYYINFILGNLLPLSDGTTYLFFSVIVITTAGAQH